MNNTIVAGGPPRCKRGPAGLGRHLVQGDAVCEKRDVVLGMGGRIPGVVGRGFVAGEPVELAGKVSRRVGANRPRTRGGTAYSPNSGPRVACGSRVERIRPSSSRTTNVFKCRSGVLIGASGFGRMSRSR